MCYAGICKQQDLSFDYNLLEVFRNGHYDKATKETQEAWLVFVGRFMVATNGVWATRYLYKPENYADLNTVADEAYIMLLLKQFIPKWDEKGFDTPDTVLTSTGEQEEGGLPMAGVGEQGQGCGSSATKRAERIRADGDHHQKAQEYKENYQFIMESRTSADGSGASWDKAFANWYRAETNQDNMERILGQSARKGGSKRKRSNSSKNVSRIVVPVEESSDDEEFDAVEPTAV